MTIMEDANLNSSTARSRRERICRVCGDKALGYNFGAVTCESCKAFFRRNALRDKKLKCPFQENCIVDTVTRRFCQKCRLAKCFSIGMKKEWIMSEEDKRKKKLKIEANKKRRVVEDCDSSMGYLSESEGMNRPQAIVIGTVRTLKSGPNDGHSASDFMEIPTEVMVKDDKFDENESGSSNTHQSSSTDESNSSDNFPVHFPSQSSPMAKLHPIIPFVEASNKFINIGDMIQFDEYYPSVQKEDHTAIIKNETMSAVNTPYPPNNLNLFKHNNLYNSTRLHDYNHNHTSVIEDPISMNENEIVLDKFNAVTCLKNVNQKIILDNRNHETANAIEHNKFRTQVTNHAEKKDHPIGCGTNSLVNHKPIVDICNPMIERSCSNDERTACNADCPKTRNPSPYFPPHPDYWQDFSVLDASRKINPQKQNGLGYVSKLNHSNSLFNDKDNKTSEHITAQTSFQNPMVGRQNNQTQSNFEIDKNLEKSKAVCDHNPVKSYSNNVNIPVTRNKILNVASDTTKKVNFDGRNSSDNIYVNKSQHSVLNSSQAESSVSGTQTTTGNQTKTVIQPTKYTDNIVNVAIAAELSNYATGQKSDVLTDMEKQMLEDLRLANTALTRPLSEDSQYLSEKDVSLLSVINMTEIAIRRLIEMSKQLPTFSEICTNDQISLLKGSCTEIMILKSVSSFDEETECWKIPEAEGTFISIQLKVLSKTPGSPKVYEAHRRFTLSFPRDCRMDDNVMLLLQAIALFSPSRPGVVHAGAIQHQQCCYLLLLKRYLEVSRGRCEGRNIYWNLLERMNDLRFLNENYIRVYMQVNPNEVKPLLIEMWDLK